MAKQFMELSLTFVMDLFRIKSSAEHRGDSTAIENLREHYPYLFTEEFSTFIANLKITTMYLDNKYGQNFTSMFEANQNASNKVH